MTAPLPSRPKDPNDSVKFSEAAADPSFRVIIDRVAEEKRAALADPGPPWKEWALHTAAKWYLGLGLLTVDGWVAGWFLFYKIYAPIAPVLAVAVYLEFLLWQYLWYRPEIFRRGRSKRSPSRWVHPVPFGRWTPEADMARSGQVVTPGQPDPSEFL